MVHIAEGSTDIVMARTFIHFLTDAKRNSLMEEIQRIIPPAAYLHLTVNGLDQSDGRAFQGGYPTHFASTFVVIDQLGARSYPIVYPLGH